MKILNGKWKPPILYFLKQSGLRYTDLLKFIPSISDRMLTKHLQELEKDQIIKRSKSGDIQEYMVTEIGYKLCNVIDKMVDWGELYLRKIKSLEPHEWKSF